MTKNQNMDETKDLLCFLDADVDVDVDVDVDRQHASQMLEQYPETWVQPAVCQLYLKYKSQHFL